MPQIGWLEILIIVVIAILIIGPKDFPAVLNKIGSTIGSIKRYFSDIQQKVSKIEENFDDDRIITHRLYSGDKNHRILQEAILGFGGMKLLDALGQESIQKYHMNEGHCSF